MISTSVARCAVAVMTWVAVGLVPMSAQQGNVTASQNVPQVRAHQPVTMYGVPAVADLRTLQADVVFLGVPCDLGHNSLPGARLGPAAIRAASAIGGPPGADGFYDRETGEPFMKGVRLADAGDIVIPTANVSQSLANLSDRVDRCAWRNARDARRRSFDHLRRSPRPPDIYDQVLEREPDDRAAFLASQSGDDAELQREVQSLLAQDDERLLLDEPIVETAAEVMDEFDLRPGTQLGPPGSTRSSEPAAWVRCIARPIHV